MALVALGGLGYCLADRRRPAWWILVAVEAAQACLHVWFSWCTPAATVPVPMRMPMPMPGESAVVRGGTVMSHGAGMSLGMFGAHVLAGLLVAAWLYAGERALWRALRVVAEFLVVRTLRTLILLAQAGLPSRCARPAPVTIGRGDNEVAPAVVVLQACSGTSWSSSARRFHSSTSACRRRVAPVRALPAVGVRVAWAVIRMP